VSVVILVLNDGARAARCIETIRATTTLDAEIIVVANGTQDEHLQAISSRSDIVLLRLAVNLGFGRGCNAGAALAKGRYIALLNDDVDVAEGWLETLLKTADENPGVGVVGSKVMFPDGRLQDAGGILWNDATSARVGWRDGDVSGYDVIRDVDYASGCSMLILRTVWEQLGGFDSKYFPAYYEDADLCMRIRELGLRVLYQPESTIVHDESGSTTPRWRVFISERNRLRFLERWSERLATHEAPLPPTSPFYSKSVDSAIRRASADAAAAAPERKRRN
jgi:GT2 family glycosyltransferase